MQMNTNERWSLFYQTFEISLQFIHILETADIFWCNFFLQILVLGYSELLVLPFSCFSYHVLWVSFVVLLSFVDIHVLSVCPQLGSAIYLLAIYLLEIFNITDF